jgi:hypothetical protein
MTVMNGAPASQASRGSALFKARASGNSYTEIREEAMAESNARAAHFDVDAWIATARGARMIELDHPLQKGMPIYPTHPPFHITLNNRHGDLNRG